MKIGRNAPCPCGSGKKYKKCCLTQDEATRAEKRTEALGDKRLYQELRSITERLAEKGKQRQAFESMDVNTLIQELAGMDIDFSQDDLRAYAETGYSFCDLAARLADTAEVEGYAQDNVYTIVKELWQIWAPDMPCIEMVVDQVLEAEKSVGADSWERLKRFCKILSRFAGD